MQRWIESLKNLYLRIINSIAFYPTLLSIAFLLLSFFIIQIEYSAYLLELKEKLSFSLVHNSDNARLILGTIVGSIISIMVFSFSMVMVVLNRATATLSPRVLPGLISNRFHQIVLGVYLGTIIFSLLLIVNVDTPDRDFQVPSLGILISMVLSFICLSLFVYFIHSISEKIQVDNILNDLKKSTYKAIGEADFTEEGSSKNFSSEEQNTDFESWFEQKSSKSGFLKRISFQGLTSFCNANQVKVKMLIQTGTYLVEHYPFAITDKTLNDEQKEKLMACFTLYTEEHINDHFSFGFGQISEIAVKALSPGINDPGTALRAIDLLAELFIQLMLIEQQEFLRDKQKSVCVYLLPITFADVLYQTFTPIRSYGQQDALVMLQLLATMEKMLEVDEDQKLYYPEIHDFIHSTVNCCEKHFESLLDQQQFNKIINKINLKFEIEQQFELLGK